MGQIKTSLVVEFIDRVTNPIKRTKSAIDDLGRVQGTIQQFENLSGKVTQTRTQLSLTQQTVRNLRDQIASTPKPTATMTRSFEEARKQARGLLSELDQETTELGQLQDKLKGAGVDTQRLTVEQARLSRTMEGLNGRMRVMQGASSFASSVSRTASSVGTASMEFGKGLVKWGGIAVGTASAVGYGFNRMFVSTAASFEKYRIQLETLEGSKEKAKSSMDWVSQFAQKTPFEMEGVMQSFVKMRAFGMDPMNGSMQAIADQTAKLGGGQQEMEGIVLALGQAWTKQKLQGEEALQLIERGVPVWDLLSKATGKSTAELQKMSEKGQLGRHAISLLMEEMGKSSAGAANKQMQTWNGMVSNVSDTWQRFTNQVAEAGVFDALKERLGGVLKTLDRMAADGSLKKIATQVSDVVITSLDIMEGLGKGIITVFDVVTTVVKAVAAPFVQLFAIIGDGWNKIFEIVDKLSGSGIRDFIGSATASLLAGFGNKDAGRAIETNQGSEYGTAAAGATRAGKRGATGFAAPVSVATPGGAQRAGKADVGGTIGITIRQDGKAVVDSIKPNNPAVDYAVDRGLMLGGM